MKNLENSADLQEMNLQEMSQVDGGWSLAMACGGAAAVACLGPEAALLAFAVCGFM